MILKRIINTRQRPMLGKTTIGVPYEMERALAVLRSRHLYNTFFLSDNGQDVYGITNIENGWLPFLPGKLLGIHEFRNVRRWIIGDTRHNNHYQPVSMERIPSLFSEVEQRVQFESPFYKQYMHTHVLSL